MTPSDTLKAEITNSNLVRATMFKVRTSVLAFFVTLMQHPDAVRINHLQLSIARLSLSLYSPNLGKQSLALIGDFIINNSSQ